LQVKVEVELEPLVPLDPLEPLDPLDPLEPLDPLVPLDDELLLSSLHATTAVNIRTAPVRVRALRNMVAERRRGPRRDTRAHLQ
jgi:hypothetical protein